MVNPRHKKVQGQSVTKRATPIKYLSCPWQKVKSSILKVTALEGAQLVIYISSTHSSHFTLYPHDMHILRGYFTGAILRLPNYQCSNTAEYFVSI